MPERSHSSFGNAWREDDPLVVEVHGERERIILTLHYYEKLSIDDVASVLGVDVRTVRRLHQKPLRAIRRSVSEPMWERLGQLAHEAPSTPDPGGALALIRELTAA